MTDFVKIWEDKHRPCSQWVLIQLAMSYGRGVLILLDITGYSQRRHFIQIIVSYLGYNNVAEKLGNNATWCTIFEEFCHIWV